MSMLAERKRKQKWSLNPSGKEWSQDANKFGQKILEKMGWQHGKGLGAKEDGITEHIKVAYKNDSKGMGYKESNDQWTAHDTHFSALLESLSGTTERTDEIKLSSLEKKSQTSRARVHYHKFTRGKDLSRYSDKDLANIFGKKSLKEPKQEEVKQEDSSNSTIEKLEKESKFLLNAGSMRDYFKKKLPNFGRSNGYTIGSNGVLKKEESDSESEVRPSFSLTDKLNGEAGEVNNYAGLGFKTNHLKINSNEKETFVSYITEDNSAETKNKKQKKKRKTEEYDEDAVSTPQKKSKKTDEGNPKGMVNGELGLSNPAFNPMYTPVKVEKHILTTIEETAAEDVSMEESSIKDVDEIQAEVHNGELSNVMSKKKKKKAKLGESDTTEAFNGEDATNNYVDYKKKRRTLAVDNPSFEEAAEEPVDSSPAEENPYELHIKENKNKKKKKNRQISNKTTEEIVSEPCPELDERIHDSNSSKMKKKKKKIENLALENPSFDVSTDEPTDLPRTEELSYEVKRKKQKPRTLALENPSFDCSTNSSGVCEPEENSYEVKRKKKDRRLALENPSFDGTTTDSLEVCEPEENSYEVKRKKKKDRKLALENPSFDGTTTDCLEVCEPEENSYEVKRKKKKDRKLALENPSFDGTTDSLEVCEPEENSYEKKKETLALENLGFENAAEDRVDPARAEENPYEVKVSKKKKKTKKYDASAIENPAFNDSADVSTDFSQATENPFEVSLKESKKMKKKKKKSKEIFAVDNPNFDPNDPLVEMEKSKKSEEENDRVSPVLESNTPTDESKENISLNIESSDLMLNVVTTPLVTKINALNLDNTFSISNGSSVKRRKSVRFSDVTQERIIPNNDDLRNLSDIENRNELFEINAQVLNNSLLNQNNSDAPSANGLFNYDGASPQKKHKKRKLGLDNMAFDKHKNNLDENVDSISKTIDRYQAEIENDINEKKQQVFGMDDVMVGQVGNPHGENEKLPEGTKLKFRYADLKGETSFYYLGATGPKKSYKHLIKGDIVVKFNNTNLHEIKGYAVKSKSSTV